MPRIGASWKFGEYHGSVVDHGFIETTAKTPLGMQYAALKQFELELGIMNSKKLDIRLIAFTAHFPIDNGWKFEVVFLVDSFDGAHRTITKVYPTMYAHGSPCPEQFAMYQQ